MDERKRKMMNKRNERSRMTNEEKLKKREKARLGMKKMRERLKEKGISSDKQGTDKVDQVGGESSEYFGPSIGMDGLQGDFHEFVSSFKKEV